MRKLGFILLAIIGFTAMSFSQESTNTAQALDVSKLILSKDSGQYLFIFPAKITSEEVERNALNYKNMFSVIFNAATHELKINMVENTPMNRKVMMRMMLSCGIQYIVINDEEISLYEFEQAYL
jgi:hypothetical protein